MKKKIIRLRKPQPQAPQQAAAQQQAPQQSTCDACERRQRGECPYPALEQERDAVAERIRQRYRDFSWNSHPDERAVGVSSDLLYPCEWSTRTGRGYVLPDGAWYDPLGDFYGVVTVDD